MPFVQVNDVKLHHEMEGSDPPLLMVAGTGLPERAHDVWAENCGDVPCDRRVSATPLR